MGLQEVLLFIFSITVIAMGNPQGLDETKYKLQKREPPSNNNLVCDTTSNSSVIYYSVGTTSRYDLFLPNVSLPNGNDKCYERQFL